MNAIAMPKTIFKAFLQLSGGRPSNATLNYTAKLDNGLLLVDVSGKRVIVTHTNRYWFVQHIFWDKVDCADGYWCLSIDKLKGVMVPSGKPVVELDLDNLRYESVNEDYLRGLNFDNLLSRNMSGKHAERASYDAGMLYALTRFFQRAHKIVTIHFTSQEFEPLQIVSKDASCKAILMPVRS